MIIGLIGSVPGFVAMLIVARVAPAIVHVVGRVVGLSLPDGEHAVPLDCGLG